MFISITEGNSLLSKQSHEDHENKQSNIYEIDAPESCGADMHSFLTQISRMKRQIHVSQIFLAILRPSH